LEPAGLAAIHSDRGQRSSTSRAVSARPAARTPLHGFFLAGDWTDTSLPGTIESAVVSGHIAARAILENG
jgi:uncharacterized protein with NAD-binding domain and iron-sulfur cluster